MFDEAVRCLGGAFERGSTSQTVIRISRHSQSAGDSRNRAHPYPEWALAAQTCLLLTCGVQSGRTSAPRWPQFVQIIFGPSARITMLSGKSSVLAPQFTYGWGREWMALP